MPRPSPPRTRATGRREVDRVPPLGAGRVEAHHPDAARLERLERLHEVADARHLHVLERAGGGAAHGLREPGAVPLGQQRRRRRPPPRRCAGSRPGCAGPRRRRGRRGAPGRGPSSRRLSSDRTGFSETTAMMPWWGTPPAMRSSVSRISKRSGIPRWVARRMASESRRLRRPLTMSRRSKWRVPAASASNTGLMPQMRFMVVWVRSLSRGAPSRGRRCPRPAPGRRGGRCSWPSPRPAPSPPRASRRWRRASARGEAPGPAPGRRP